MAMSESNVVFLDEHREMDPILSRGHIVWIRDLDEAGIVVKVEQLFGPDSEAPGQASVVHVAVPQGEEWVIHEGVHLHELHRLVGRRLDIEEQ